MNQFCFMVMNDYNDPLFMLIFAKRSCPILTIPRIPKAFRIETLLHLNKSLISSHYEEEKVFCN